MVMLYMLNVIMLNVTNESIMLSVVMLNLVAALCALKYQTRVKWLGVLWLGILQHRTNFVQLGS
jgi:hypothetical protein